MNFVRQKILSKVEITHEVHYDEDVIRNCVTTLEVFQRKRKWNILMNLEEERKIEDPIFLGFFEEESNPLKRIDFILDKFERLYGESIVEIEVQPSKPINLSINSLKGVVIVEPPPNAVFLQ